MAAGGNRDRQVHMKSITTLKNMDMSGDIVLLMDDVTTTGNSLYTCREILLQNGARHVEMFALGKAILRSLIRQRILLLLEVVRCRKKEEN